MKPLAECHRRHRASSGEVLSNRTSLSYAKVLRMEEFEPRNPDGTYVMTKKRLKIMKKIESALMDHKRIRERLAAEHEGK